jgi:uncharacterized protein
MKAMPLSDPLASPCTKVCRIDERTGWCEGCLRTLDEIAAWSTLDHAHQRALWEALARRRVQPPPDTAGTP